MITSSKDDYNEKCYVSVNDLNKLSLFALSLEPSSDDLDISLATTYCNTLERFFRENKENDSLVSLREIYEKIKDDMIVRLLFVQHIELMIIKFNINDLESYNKYIKALESFNKSINGNEFQKQMLFQEFDTSISKTK